MRNPLKKLLLMVVLFLIFIFITGCWDNTDINERTFASAVGLDRAENGEIEMSLQILRPNIIGAINEGGSSEKAIWVATKTGETVFDAVRNQLKTLNRKPYYSHLQMIVIGEELAREGIEDVIDFFFRDQEVIITPDVIIAKGMKAKDVIQAESELETVPALHIRGILENSVVESKTRNIDLASAVHDLTAPHGNGVIGNIESIGKEKPSNIKDMKVEGASVLKEDKLIGYLDAQETRGYLFINDEVDGGIIDINHPMEEGKKISIEIFRSSSKIKTRIKDGKLAFDVDIKLEGSIGDFQGHSGVIDQDMLQKVEDATIKEIEEDVHKVIKVAQKQYKTDFVGLGSEVFRNYPQYWEEIKDNWDEEFIETSINVNTEVSIQRTGLISKPIMGQ